MIRNGYLSGEHHLPSGVTETHITDFQVRVGQQPCILLTGDALERFRAFTASDVPRPEESKPIVFVTEPGEVSQTTAGLTCWHGDIDDDGFCRGCGKRAAIRFIDETVSELSAEPSSSVLKRTKLQAETELAQLLLQQAKSGDGGQRIWERAFISSLQRSAVFAIAGSNKFTQAGAEADMARAQWQQRFGGDAK